MRTLITTLVLLLAAPLLAAERIDLRILYCGNPGSPREADFRELLERHFTKVSTGNYEAFTAGQADGYDVVIFDWTEVTMATEASTQRSRNSSGLRSTPASPVLPS